MMKISLTQGKFALVDVEDFSYLSNFRWSAAKHNGRFVSCTKIKGKNVLMHRLITKATDGQSVDHRNHDTLDNRKSNLRLCTHQENCLNRKKWKKGNKLTSKYKGVSLRKDSKKFRATICFFGKLYSLGDFRTQKEAANAYDKKATELHGDFASLNFRNTAP